MTNCSIPNASEAEDMMRETIARREVRRTKAPRPYSANLPQPSLRTSANGVSLRAASVPNPTTASKKVSIVGCGQVGMAIAYSILNQETAGTICLVDMNGEKLHGEALDLRQGSAFHKKVSIIASTDYAATANSHFVIITAGVAQKVGESRLSLLEKNVKIMKSIIPHVLQYSPDAPICIVSNPCDIMTAVASKIAGPTVPPGRIFGSGTCLDSSRLRSLIARTLDIDGKSVHGYIIGEHGDSSVAVWSSVRVGGLSFIPPEDKPGIAHAKMHAEVVASAGEVIKRKGYTNWSVGLAAAHITQVVLSDTRSILPLSTCVRGFHGIENDVHLSLPCLLGYDGIRSVLDLPLTEEEKEGFVKSAEKVWDSQKDCWDNL